MRGRRGQPRHLRAAEFQALRDGQAPLWLRLRGRAHLQRCARCAARQQALGADDEQIKRLLGSAPRAPDVAEGWARLRAVQPQAGGRRPGRRATGAPLLAVAALLVVAALAPSVLVNWRPTSDLTMRLFYLSAQGGYSPKEAGPADHEFGQVLARLEREGLLERRRDECCGDRDGEGPADDGVLTVELLGSRSTVTILYEDTNWSGRYEPGDVILVVSRPGLSAKDPLALLQDEPGDVPAGPHPKPGASP